jgi:predicted PurR-regulated permease PerM
MLFAGVLLAIFLRTLAVWVADATGLSPGVALTAVILGLLGVATLGGWMYAPRLAEQSDRLSETLPQAAHDLTSTLEGYGWGRWVMEQLSSSASNGDVVSQAQTMANRLMSAGVAFVVILFSGLYLAAEPGPYIRGLLRLVPPDSRRMAAEVMFAIGGVLRWWLVGQALAMAVVGLLMGIGLWLIGVQLALILGLLAGLLEFIPFVGPVAAFGPALLLALANSGQQAAYVLALYLVVQTLEGYVLTPLVQRQAVELPPVLTISAQVGLSMAAGAIGLLVAVPLAAVAMVAVQMLYVDQRLGDSVAADIRDNARREVDRERAGLLKGLLPAT